MHIPQLLSQRFADAIARSPFADQVDDIQRLAGMIRIAGNPKFGDYQANFAMPLSKMVSGSNPRDVAQQVVDLADLDQICEAPEVAGPGFINLKLRDDFITNNLVAMLDDPRCLVGQVDSPKKILIDYSSPNVAKPMHVGHIRTTVIGHCLAQTLAFMGHEIITDNHLGDWGTQFGMIIYGYKHFGDPNVVAADPVPELSKLYRLVHQLMSYHKAVSSLPKLDHQIETLSLQREEALKEAEAVEGKEAKKKRKLADSISKKIAGSKEGIEKAKSTIKAIDSDPEMKSLAEKHSSIATAVLEETSKLHAGDEENKQLWEQFLPHCKDEINRVYNRLNVSFDHTLGESFYHPMLRKTVDDLRERGLATESDGAICVFLDQFDAPMIIQKRDGAFLYATTDLATLKYREEEFSPDEILYVVDARQSEHFEKLFAVAELTKLTTAKLVHVSFGTVLGEDGKPIKTRSGTLIGLESLLDDAVEAAYQVVCDPDRIVNLEPPMGDDEKRQVSETIGIGAIKYADLSHHRTSDYQFKLSKMVALSGNTATYAQYNYARTPSILQRNGVTEKDVHQRVAESGLILSHPAERDLALMLMRFEEALSSVYDDYAPNHLVDYVYGLAESFAKFNTQCHVLRAESNEIQTTRLALVVLTGRVLQLGLRLLGIDVVERM
ncbi:arginine--tRNA ligase [Rhodopirellula sp. MGV]|uniref:arginine--tRNA ligase n=1 Tax=Rhodopirellula sp. MGV TaxID=2023130 RepID=UPI000B9663F1|nr:arginine--tRNA ligase [Rhodopirellula sp. MGV]OYP28960.1 arginine--tRNA ligase [Rhodopirellula sp. MGV]PNY36925.1 arginine--tRNA ligase [Rhodopirellula baltica]